MVKAERDGKYKDESNAATARLLKRSHMTALYNPVDACPHSDDQWSGGVKSAKAYKVR